MDKQWEESKHPRDEDGKFTSGGGTPAEHKRLKELGIETKEDNTRLTQSSEKIEAVKPLIDTLKKIKKIKTKELWNYIKSLKPVKLKMNEEEIIAEFDKYTANKFIFGHGKSDTAGYNYKVSNINQIPKIIENSKYSFSKRELGKTTPQHKGVKDWHYFINNIKTEKGSFNVVVNVRDKGKNQYIYEIAFKKKKT